MSTSPGSSSRADANIFRDLNFATPLKSAIAGQNVTITSPSAELHTGIGIKIYYYLSP